jgi:hypothetical protein
MAGCRARPAAVAASAAAATAASGSRAAAAAAAAADKRASGPAGIRAAIGASGGGGRRGRRAGGEAGGPAVGVGGSRLTRRPPRCRSGCVACRGAVVGGRIAEVRVRGAEAAAARGGGGEEDDGLGRSRLGRRRWRQRPREAGGGGGGGGEPGGSWLRHRLRRGLSCGGFRIGGPVRAARRDFGVGGRARDSPALPVGGCDAVGSFACVGLSGDEMCAARGARDLTHVCLNLCFLIGYCKT